MNLTLSLAILLINHTLREDYEESITEDIVAFLYSALSFSYIVTLLQYNVHERVMEFTEDGAIVAVASNMEDIPLVAVGMRDRVDTLPAAVEGDKQGTLELLHHSKDCNQQALACTSDKAWQPPHQEVDKELRGKDLQVGVEHLRKGWQQ